LSGFYSRYESYTIDVKSTGEVLLKADYYLGIKRALATLWHVLINPDGVKEVTI